MQHAIAFVSGNRAKAPERAAALLQKHRHCAATLRASGQLSSDQSQRLREVLLERGVPQAALEDGTRSAISKLGAGPIAKALAHKAVWPQLKALGSQPSNMFRWIQHDELAAHIEERAQAKFKPCRCRSTELCRNSPSLR